MTQNKTKRNAFLKVRGSWWLIPIVVSFVMLFAGAQPASAFYPGMHVAALLAQSAQAQLQSHDPEDHVCGEQLPMGAAENASWIPAPKLAPSLLRSRAKSVFGINFEDCFVACEGADIVVRWSHDRPPGQQFVVYESTQGGQYIWWHRIGRTTSKVFVDELALLSPSAVDSRYKVILEPQTDAMTAQKSRRTFDVSKRLE